MPDLKTIGATLFTLTVVGAAVRWSLDERSQIGLALRDELVATRGAHGHAGGIRDTTPNLVLLVVDPDLPASRCAHREASVTAPLPGWTSYFGLNGVEPAALLARLSDDGDAQLSLPIGDPAFADWFTLQVAAEALAGSEVATTAGFYSCIRRRLDSAPDDDRFVKIYGIEGVLTLASTRFECGARIPFHFEARRASDERRWEARGVFEFP